MIINPYDLCELGLDWGRNVLKMRITVTNLQNATYNKTEWVSFKKVKVKKAKQSLYTPWRRLGGEEVYLLLIHDLGTRWG
jgi:hypothetical protein